MKKIFTLITMALMALSANAQDFNASSLGDSFQKGYTLLDNEFVTIVSGVQDSGAALIQTETGSDDPKTYGGYTFTKYINIRVDKAPAEDNNYEGTAYTGATPNGISLIVTTKKNVDMTLYYKHGSGKEVSCFDQTTKDNVAITETAVEGLSGYYTGVYKFQGGHTYTIYARGGTTALNGITTVTGTFVEPTNKVYGYSESANLVTYGDGATMQISSNTSKSFSAGKAITVNGASYTGIKNSNGAQNTFTAATGKKIYCATFYAMPNTDGEAPKFTEFNGTTVDCSITTVKDGTNPTAIKMCVNGASSVTFTFSSKQVNFVVDVDYSESAYDEKYDPTKTTGILSTIAAKDADGVKKVVKNGQLVIIKNGEEFNAAGSQIK